MWPHMRETVRARLNKCALCAVHHTRQEHVAMGDMPLPATPMQVVSIDLVGPFVASSRNNKYLFTVMDHCSGWAEAYPIPDKWSQTVEHFFHNRFIPAHGYPEVLISDNGMKFTAAHWEAYLKSMGIKHVRCTPQHPESNGKIERFHRTFKNMLSKAINNAPGDWEDHVGSVLFSHHISVSDVTHYSPFYLVYCRQPRAPLTKLLHSRDAIQGFGTRVDNLSTALKAAREHTEDSRKYNKIRLDRKANDGLLNPGDMVVLLASEPLTFTSKWDPHWQVTRISGTTVLLRHQQSGQTKRVHRSKVRLVDQHMVWDHVAPKPKRRQRPRGTPEVTVDIPVNTPDIAVNPPRAHCGQENTLDSSEELLPSTSADPMELETEVSEPVHPHTQIGNPPTPVISLDVSNGLTHSGPIKTPLPVAREPQRGSQRRLKRSLSPPEVITSRPNTRWSSLSEEEKRHKRVRYDVLAGRTNRFNDIGHIYTIEANRHYYQKSPPRIVNTAAGWPVLPKCRVDGVNDGVVPHSNEGAARLQQITGNTNSQG